MHPLTRERLASFVLASLLTFFTVWFLVSLIAEGGGG
jgi:hypothetical protein